MIALFLVAAAGAAALMGHHQPATKSPADPLVGALLKPEPKNPDAADLYTKVRAERRGPWAVRTEQQLKTRLMSLPLVGKGGNVLRVTCGSTMCEVAGTLPAKLADVAVLPPPPAPPPGFEMAPPPPPPTSYLEKLGLTKGDLAKLGLKENAIFIRWHGQMKPLVFLNYYSRQGAAAK